MSSAAPIYDLAVIGAGPAGAAAAFHAARAGLRVVLLDKSEFPRDKICGDGLTARAVVELQKLGLEAEVQKRGARIHQFQMTAPLGRVVAQLKGAPGFPDYAYVLPRLQLDMLLVERAVAAGAELRTQQEVTHWDADDNGITLTIKTSGSTQKLRARLAILATGAHLALAQRMRLLTRKPEMMVASRQYLEGLEQQDTWHLHFGRSTLPGYGWIFPAGNGLANVGIGLEHRRRDRSLNDDLARYLSSKPAQIILKGAKAVAPPKNFPLRWDFLQSPLTAPRLLIAGEAAGLVNPLTGEGIDYALESGHVAATHAIRTLQAGIEDPATYAAALHAEYDKLFVFSQRLRDWCRTPWGVSTLALGAMARPDLKMRLVGSLLGGHAAPSLPTAKRLLKALLRPQPTN
ncbi:MAG: geranylgeranyl reductase family protein [Pseudomonadota bacterium]